MPFVATPDWFRSCEILDPPAPSDCLQALLADSANFRVPSSAGEHVRALRRRRPPGRFAVHAVLNQIGHTTFLAPDQHRKAGARGLVHGKPSKFVS